MSPAQYRLHSSQQTAYHITLTFRGHLSVTGVILPKSINLHFGIATSPVSGHFLSEPRQFGFDAHPTLLL